MASIITPSGTFQAYRASLLHFSDDPAFAANACSWHEDGLLIVNDGKVHLAGDFSQLIAFLPQGTPLHDYRGKIIMPGFIDTHVHYPQTDMIASPAPVTTPTTRAEAPSDPRNGPETARIPS